jgi:hypothetical protein
MEFLTFITDGPIFPGVFTLMLFACDNRVVNFSHEMMELTSTGTEMLISKFSIFAYFLANHILDIFHVPKVCVSSKLISESVPIEEISNELQSTSKIFIEYFISEMFQIFSGAWTFFNGLVQNTDSILELFIFLS